MVYNESFHTNRPVRYYSAANSSTIGVHVRGRNPDAERKPKSLVHYMRAVDYHARHKVQYMDDIFSILYCTGRPVRLCVLLLR